MSQWTCVRCLCVFALMLVCLPAGRANPERPHLQERVDTAGPESIEIRRVTTVTPFPRGLALHGGRLYVLSRGRVRGAGGVSAEVNDRAGTLWVCDPTVTQPADETPVAPRIRANGRVLAEPTEPPFRLWDRAASPPQSDRMTDRPYCGLRFHEPTQSFYICAFSGIDMPRRPGRRSFSKNLTDALLRYDLRTERWHELERHDPRAGGSYPHHDPRYNPPPHGWLNGPDNLLTVNNSLFAVAKDNNCLVRYDLSPLLDAPHADAPPSERLLGSEIEIAGRGRQSFYGHSMLAYRDGWLYVGYRTSSVIIRIRCNPDGEIATPIRGELVARFQPYDPRTDKSANLTDMDFGPDGYLYVVSAQPSRIYRFRADPSEVFDATRKEVLPWVDLAAQTDNLRMKSENLLVANDGRVFVTSGDGYAYQQGASGTVYVIVPKASASPSRDHQPQ